MVGRLLVRQDEKGRWLGHEVVEKEAFTYEELNPVRCSECGLANGAHGEYLIKTGQHPAGSVEGYYKKCSKAAA